MQFLIETLQAVTWQHVVMWIIGLVLIYLAIKKEMEPALLLPIGFYLNRYLLPMITPSFANYTLYMLLQTIIIENAMPSSADFKVARMYFLGVVMYAVLAVALLTML